MLLRPALSQAALASGHTILIQLLTALISDPVKWPLCRLESRKASQLSRAAGLLKPAERHPRPDRLAQHLAQKHVLLIKQSWTNANRR